MKTWNFLLLIALIFVLFPTVWVHGLDVSDGNATEDSVQEGQKEKIPSTLDERARIFAKSVGYGALMGASAVGIVKLLGVMYKRYQVDHYALVDAWIFERTMSDPHYAQLMSNAWERTYVKKPFFIGGLTILIASVLYANYTLKVPQHFWKNIKNALRK